MNDTKIHDGITPHSAILHFEIAEILKRFEPIKILDMGGKGKLGHFIKAQVRDGNIETGMDCTNLSRFEDDWWDATCSVAVLEHVSRPRTFLMEAIRTCSLGTAHWFPWGPAAAQTEEFKRSKFVGHYRHPCRIPNSADLKDLNFKMYPFITVREHLLMLATMYKQFNCSKVYDYISKYGSDDYGVIAYRSKSCS